ncbi:hypothetical protein CK203_112153 [Vitis vinifera]|uniref:Uncharacterized protein n=1 Tax=Vitis vinifera TaxID=29760 RepID=A0A438CCP3_VITVI|nr:hypothetical protein CK203_112153 [Vitis vinifera]
MIGELCGESFVGLGASVNLLPYSVYKQLGLGELKPTSITLSLADRSMKIPRGMIEDVLVQVDKFYYQWILLFLIRTRLPKELTIARNNSIQKKKKDQKRFACYSTPLEKEGRNLPLFNREETPEALRRTPKAYSKAITHGVEEDCLLEVLRRCKKAIGWQISNLERINPLVYSPWVSPMQVMLNKSGITVVQNGKEKKCLHASLQVGGLGSQQSNTSNGVQFGVELKKLEPLEADHTKLKANFTGCEITRGMAVKWCPSACEILQPSCTLAKSS